MAIRRDWFKRQVEILAQALGSALGLKQKGETQASIAALEGALQSAFGVSGKLALGLSLQDFISLACRGEEPSAELLAALSRLFSQWAALLEAQGRSSEASAARSRAQVLLEMASQMRLE
ncbi:MAG: hypothetical protein HY921_07020 [Elusimicrobia bacterium]|nr:hypothetical protein [Elusimicrobiota bacterium]